MLSGKFLDLALAGIFPRFFSFLKCLKARHSNNFKMHMINHSCALFIHFFEISREGNSFNRFSRKKYFADFDCMTHSLQIRIQFNLITIVYKNSLIIDFLRIILI